MSLKFLQKIQLIEKERQELISQLSIDWQMVKGSFCQIFVKCGRKACWCYQEKGHPHKRMSLHEYGKNYSRAVPAEDYEWVEKMTTNYRRYRLIRRQLSKLENEIKRLIDQHEEKILKKTKKGKTYLEIFEPVSEPSCEKSSGRAKKSKS
jgi:hypothetical protein